MFRTRRFFAFQPSSFLFEWQFSYPPPRDLLLYSQIFIMHSDNTRPREEIDFPILPKCASIMCQSKVYIPVSTGYYTNIVNIP